VTETRSIGEILRDAAAGRLETLLREDREPYDLIGAADRLFDLLASREIPFVLVGGIAMLQYVDGRNTRDVDLIVGPEFLGRLPEVVVVSEDHDFARADFEGVQLDVLKTSNAVFQFVAKHHVRNASFGRRSVPCATPAGLFVLKAYALPSLYRQGEFARADIYENDLLALLRTHPIDVEAAVSELTPHMLPSDIKAIREVLVDIADRLKKSLDRARTLDDTSEA
jgi:hypothetical protein